MAFGHSQDVRASPWARYSYKQDDYSPPRGLHFLELWWEKVPCRETRRHKHRDTPAGQATLVCHFCGHRTILSRTELENKRKGMIIRDYMGSQYYVIWCSATATRSSDNSAKLLLFLYLQYKIIHSFHYVFLHSVSFLGLRIHWQSCSLHAHLKQHQFIKDICQNQFLNVSTLFGIWLGQLQEEARFPHIL